MDGLGEVIVSLSAAALADGLGKVMVSLSAAALVDGLGEVMVSLSAAALVDGLGEVVVSPSAAALAEGLGEVILSPSAAALADGLGEVTVSPSAAALEDGLGEVTVSLSAGKPVPVSVSSARAAAGDMASRQTTSARLIHRLMFCMFLFLQPVIILVLFTRRDGAQLPLSILNTINFFALKIKNFCTSGHFPARVDVLGLDKPKFTWSIPRGKPWAAAGRRE